MLNLNKRYFFPDLYLNMPLEKAVYQYNMRAIYDEISDMYFFSVRSELSDAIYKFFDKSVITLEDLAEHFLVCDYGLPKYKEGNIFTYYNFKSSLIKHRINVYDNYIELCLLGRENHNTLPQYIYDNNVIIYHCCICRQPGIPSIIFNIDNILGYSIRCGCDTEIHKNTHVDLLESIDEWNNKDSNKIDMYIGNVFINYLMLDIPPEYKHIITKDISLVAKAF